MKPGEGVSDRGKGSDQILHREVAQAKKNERILDRRRLSVGDFPAGFTLWWGGRDDGGLKAFSGGGREVARGREPLIQFGVAGKAAAENISLQSREFELLVGDRVASAERCPENSTCSSFHARSRSMRRPLVAN